MQGLQEIQPSGICTGRSVVSHIRHSCGQIGWQLAQRMDNVCNNQSGNMITSKFLKIESKAMKIEDKLDVTLNRYAMNDCTNIIAGVYSFIFSIPLVINFLLPHKYNYC